MFYLSLLYTLGGAHHGFQPAECPLKGKNYFDIELYYNKQYWHYFQ